MAELKQLGKYKIEELIGSGAYADVFRAVDHLNRKVALKVLKTIFAGRCGGPQPFCTGSTGGSRVIPSPDCHSA